LFAQFAVRIGCTQAERVTPGVPQELEVELLLLELELLELAPLELLLELEPLELLLELELELEPLEPPELLLELAPELLLELAPELLLVELELLDPVAPPVPPEEVLPHPTPIATMKAPSTVIACCCSRMSSPKVVAMDIPTPRAADTRVS
jgi:hypothetical protein